MNSENLEFINEYEEKDHSYELILDNLVECIKNVQLSTTQTSLNLARIRLLMEIEFAAEKLTEFRDIDIETLYAFCCRIDFKKWAMTFDQYSHNIRMIEDADILNYSDNSSELNIDKRIFDGFIHSIDNYNTIAEYDNDKTISDSFISSIGSLTTNCDSETIKEATATILWKFSNYLNDIGKTISTPSLDSLRFLYNSFANIMVEADSDKENQFLLFLQKSQDKPDFLSLLKERMDKLFENDIKLYCAEKEVLRNLFDWNPICHPSPVKIGDFIWQYRDKSNKIEIALNIVRFTNEWCSLNNLITAISSREHKNSPNEVSNDTEKIVKNNRSDEPCTQIVEQSVPSNHYSSFVVDIEIVDMVIREIQKLMNGKTKPKDVIMPIRAAIEAGVIRRPTWKEFQEEFGIGLVSKGSYSNYTDQTKKKYEKETAFDVLVERFKTLKK